MAHQAVMKKIQFLLRQNGVFGYRGGAIALELELDNKASFPLESKFLFSMFSYLSCYRYLLQLRFYCWR